MPEPTGQSLRLWSSADDPFLPQILVRHPGSFTLVDFEDEHLIAGRDPDDSESHEQAYTLDILQFTGRRNRVRAGRVIPTTRRSDHSGIVFDLARIRLLSDRSSELLIDSEIGSGRSYFYNTLRPLVNHAASLRSSVQLHAALGYWGETGVLMPGGSGSGKSTLSMLAALFGQQVVTDDLALIAPVPDGIAGRSLRRHFFLRPRTFGLLPEAVRNEAVDVEFMGQQKHVLLRHQLVSETLNSAPISVILFPEIGELPASQAFQIKLVPKTEALVRLVQNMDPFLMNTADTSAKARLMSTLQSGVGACICLQLRTTSTVLEDPARYIGEIVDEVLELSHRC